MREWRRDKIKERRKENKLQALQRRISLSRTMWNERLIEKGLKGSVVAIVSWRGCGPIYYYGQQFNHMKVRGLLNLQMTAKGPNPSVIKNRTWSAAPIPPKRFWVVEAKFCGGPPDQWIALLNIPVVELDGIITEPLPI